MRKQYQLQHKMCVEDFGLVAPHPTVIVPVVHSEVVAEPIEQFVYPNEMNLAIWFALPSNA
jgi:hypothetical protein